VKGSSRRRAAVSLACLALFAAAPGAAREGAVPAPAEPGVHRSAETMGLSVDLRIEPLEAPAASLREGQLVRFRFALADAATGTPFSGLYPAAWMDLRPPEVEGESGRCAEKVERLLSGSLLSRAELDLNAFYVVTLNDDASLSVVDPLFGFGGSKLLAMVPLWSPGEDWALTADRRRLFVSMPGSDAVAAVDTGTWKVLSNVPTGQEPRRLVLQPDGGYLWVGHDGAGADPKAPSGVTVLVPSTLGERARIATGRGHHEIALTGDSRFAFVTNEDDGTVSVIDVRSLAVVATLPTGPRPVSIDWCEAAQTVYVAHAGDGTLVAIDGELRREPRRLETGHPGLAQVRCSPDGRLAFAVNPGADLLHVIDTASGRLVQTGPVGDGPDQVSFSDTLAYVHHGGSDTVLMVPLAEVGVPGRPIPVVDFPGGKSPPAEGGLASLAPAIVRAPGASAVLVANPADGMVYYYMEGMAAPMGAFETYGRRPRAVEVIDNSLEEQSPGIYETTARLRRPGTYDVAFFLDSPRAIHCFEVEVAADPALEARRRERPLEVHPEAEPADGAFQVPPGGELRLTLRATDPASGEPRSGLEDLEVMTMLASGTWHLRRPARELGEGRYEVTLPVPEEGIYYLYATSPSAGLALGDVRPMAYVVAAGAP
jgi:YVTN family beta-propeller protein